MDHHMTQLHYLGWPDHGVPKDPQNLLDLHKLIRNTQGDSNNPILVHSSAGVGRAGVLIGFDTVSREVEAGARDVDVFNVVYGMREDRMGMVGWFGGKMYIRMSTVELSRNIQQLSLSKQLYKCSYFEFSFSIIPFIA